MLYDNGCVGTVVINPVWARDCGFVVSRRFIILVVVRLLVLVVVLVLALEYVSIKLFSRTTTSTSTRRNMGTRVYAAIFL